MAGIPGNELSTANSFVTGNKIPVYGADGSTCVVRAVEPTLGCISSRFSQNGAAKTRFESLTAADFETLEQSWIWRELAAQAGIYRVDGYIGAQIVGREKDLYTDKYAGLVLPYRAPFQYEGV